MNNVVFISYLTKQFLIANQICNFIRSLGYR